MSGKWEWRDKNLSIRIRDPGPMLVLTNIDTDKIVLHKYLPFCMTIYECDGSTSSAYNT